MRKRVGFVIFSNTSSSIKQLTVSRSVLYTFFTILLCAIIVLLYDYFTLKIAVYNMGRIDPDIRVQISKLNKIQITLLELHEIIKNQKTEMVEQDKKVSQLKKERDKLITLVNADRKVIDTTLAFHKKQLENIFWKNTIIGAVLGFIVSLIAGLLIIFFTTKGRRLSDKDWNQLKEHAKIISAVTKPE